MARTRCAAGSRVSHWLLRLIATFGWQKRAVLMALSLCGCQIFEQRFPAERLVGLPAATPARASA